MTDTLIADFDGPKVIAGAIDHHIFVREIIEGTSANFDLAAQQLFTDLGTKVDPDTGRAFFDIGGRADNMIALPTNGMAGQITHVGPHPGASAFAREVHYLAVNKDGKQVKVL